MTACEYGEAACVVCDATCHDAPGALVGRCGDDLVQTAFGEVCDGAATPTCQSLEFASGTATPTCQALGFVAGTTSCDGCTLDTTGCTNTRCGNGTIDAGEQCDGPTTVTCPYGAPSCQQCSPTCQLEPGLSSGYCGDGVRQPSEACDGNALGTAGVCAAHGFVWGTAGCHADCTIDTSGCHSTADPCAGKTIYSGAADLDIGDGYTLPAGVDLQCLALISGAGKLNLRGPYTTFSQPLLPRLRVVQSPQTNVYEWPATHPFPNVVQFYRLTFLSPLSNIHIDLSSLETSSVIDFREPITNVRVTAGSRSTSFIVAGTGWDVRLPNATSLGLLMLNGSGTLSAPGVSEAGSLYMNGGPITGLSGLRTVEDLGMNAAQTDLVNLTRVTRDAGLIAGQCAATLGSVCLPALNTVVGTLELTAGGGIARARLPVLTHAGSVVAGRNAYSPTNSGLTGIELPMLQEISITLDVSGIVADFTTLSLPSLWRVGNTFTVRDNALLSTCAVKALRAQLTSGPITTTIVANLPDCTYP